MSIPMYLFQPIFITMNLYLLMFMFINVHVYIPLFIQYTYQYL